MELHTLKPFKGSRKKAKRVGRGLGSSHGTYSTRGMKGQRARSGGSKGLKLKGMKQLLLRIPKLGGFKSIYEKDIAVNVDVLQHAYKDGEIVSPVTLIKRNVVTVPKKGMPVIKILGAGTLAKKLTITHCRVSESAKKKIEAAGGTIIFSKKKK